MAKTRGQFGRYLLLLALGGGLGLWSSQYWEGSFGRDGDARTASPAPPAVVPTVTEPVTPPAPGAAAERELNFIAQAVQQVGPAVVRIDASQVMSQRQGVPDSLREPLRRFFGEGEDPGREERRVRQGTGSGFILSANGRVLTNAHVVEGADRVDVTMRDGRRFQGVVLGTDAVTDVAVIQIEADEALPNVQLGESESIVPGEWAIAIGNPLGLNNTVTVGIVSAVDRPSADVGVPDKRVRFIQTDAAINPGNSGGPLLNADGEVIGVNTAIRANAQGLGFAIPIETAARIANQLVASGQADHPYLGIQMVTLTPQLRAELERSGEFPGEIGVDEGVAIVRVVPGSPADRAGFEPGDVILQVGDTPIATSLEVQERVDASEIGADLEVEVRRDGRRQTVVVQPGMHPDS